MSDEKTPLLKAIIINIPLSVKELGIADVTFDPTRGLSLEELLQYQNDPWWKNLRRACFLSFWFVLCLMFGLSCILMFEKYELCRATNMIVIAKTLPPPTTAPINSSKYKNNTLGSTATAEDVEVEPLSVSQNSDVNKRIGARSISAAEDNSSHSSSSKSTSVQIESDNQLNTNNFR